jgi:hypothetical protein
MHGRRPEFFGMGMQPRPKERPTAEFCPVQVLLDGLGGGIVETDGPALIAFFAQTQGRLFAVLPKIFHQEMTAGRQADAAIKVELHDGPIPVGQHRIAGGQIQELPGARRRQRKGFFPRIGGLAGNELAVRRIGDDDGQPELGRREGQLLIKGREGRNPVIDGFGGGASGGESIPVFLDFGNRHQEEARRFLGPDDSPVPDERKNALLIRAPGVETARPIHPAFEDRIDGGIKGWW